MAPLPIPFGFFKPFLGFCQDADRLFAQLEWEVQVHLIG
jgi:hypothetical protein